MSDGSVAPVVGIIGGSGMHNIEGFTDMRWEYVDTPFGPPSDALCFASLDGQPVTAFHPGSPASQAVAAVWKAATDLLIEPEGAS